MQAYITSATPLHAQTAGITTTLAWTLLNSGVALIGYYFSAALVDNIYWGRVRIQLIGFTMVRSFSEVLSEEAAVDMQGSKHSIRNTSARLEVLTAVLLLLRELSLLA